MAASILLLSIGGDDFLPGAAHEEHGVDVLGEGVDVHNRLLRLHAAKLQHRQSRAISFAKTEKDK